MIINSNKDFLMTNNILKGHKVAIVLTDGFEQSEMTEPRKALQEAGADVFLISPKKETVKGWKHVAWGDEFSVDQVIEKAKAEDFDALMLPGGVMNPDNLRLNEKVIQFISSFVKANKPIAAICHGPWTLINAGGVKGKEMTSWPSLKVDLANAGATWVDKPVVRDGNLVTSRKPDDLPHFNKAMIEMLAENNSLQ
jgi:protease I